MRLGLIPEGVFDSLALAAGAAPTPIFLGFWGLGACRTMMAGVRLGVFDALDGSEKERAAADLARVLDCNPSGLETLLNALASFGYLTRRGPLYRNGSVASRWLTSGSKSSMRYMVFFLYQIWDFFGSLEDAVRGKETHLPDLHDPERSPELWEDYLRGLAALARPQTWELVRRIPMPKSPKSLLDVGGGHGVFSMALCEHHKTLNAEVLDLPHAVTVGRKIVAEDKMEHRVRFRPGDMRDADFGSEHDAILLFILIHHFSPEEVQRAFAKAFSALRPGGTIALFEPEHRGGDAVTQSGGMTELLFYLTSRARSYPEETLRSWLQAAGFEKIQITRPLVAPTSVLVTASRPDHR